MSQTNLECDQAIFTSTRTPMGEGYRIIAASKGLAPKEKQIITRSSPSHDALCFSPDAATDAGQPTIGVSFYTLPTGRHCVALSCFAGAEHTGRGGHRTYTHNVVFAADDFPLCEYNPFHIVRSMIAADLLTPQLSPPAMLPQLQLPLDHASTKPMPRVCLSESLPESCRRFVLNGLLEEENMVLNLPTGWLDTAEALLMGVPGPARKRISLSAGLRFSAGRNHRLQLLGDATNTTKNRLAGQHTEYINPAAFSTTTLHETAWTTFVDRHWTAGEIACLAQRTSLGFQDTGATGRERIATLYNTIDNARQTETPKLLALVGEHFDAPGHGAEKKIGEELRSVVHTELLRRFTSTPWSQWSPFWPVVVVLGRRSADAATFTHSLIDQTVRGILTTDPATAARAALPIAVQEKASGDEGAMNSLIDTVLRRLSDWAYHATEAELVDLADVAGQWLRLRPNCVFAQDVEARCGEATAHVPRCSTLNKS